ncbi:SDR family oxidoreductase [Herbiconiux sp. CPCC 205716]|uniref:SDR family oxidoreductase n=1 Tax=Herbiconiux gentiana TaxID=2970912 RepID=A0ABT2GLI0_9MICO|nr:SDR family oxidoreductase [Herbiconiux gentiana]MCS5716462.1 SDR family oxidoreductase [Herbiconiux gentiana]
MDGLSGIFASVTGSEGALRAATIRALQREGAQIIAPGGAADVAVFLAPSPAELELPPGEAGEYVKQLLDGVARAVASLSPDESVSRSLVIVAPSIGQTFRSGPVPLSAAIGALKGFSRAVVVKHGDRGVRSNIVLPGILLADAELTESLPTIPLQRAVGELTHPGEVAEAVAFLASSDAGYISGAELDIDGGLSGDRHSAMSVLWAAGVMTPDRNPIQELMTRGRR